ncbi:hypothetical protein Tco_0298342 [Tanacetum coccineum]
MIATKPKTMQDAIEFATELMDKKISTFAERQAENKRKLDNNNQTQQQLPKRQNVAQAYAGWDLVKGSSIWALFHCATRAEFHHMDRALAPTRLICPELKNGNQAGGARTHGMVFALVGGEPNQDLDDMEDNTNA